MTYGEKKQKKILEKVERAFKPKNINLESPIIDAIVDNIDPTQMYLALSKMDELEVKEDDNQPINQQKEIRKAFVPEEFKGEEVEAFFQAMEKKTVEYHRKKTRILDRSKLPWQFVSFKLAAYVASKLYGFKIASPYARMEEVLGHDYGSLQSRLKNGSAIGALEVDEAYDECKCQ